MNVARGLLYGAAMPTVPCPAGLGLHWYARSAGAAFLALSVLLGAATHPALADGEAEDARALPNAPLHERILGIAGDSAQPVTLQVTLYTPDGPGPFPLAVMNHGADGISAHNRGQRYHLTFSAYYFLSRGYAVALPMMRGFAGSGGNLIERGCDLGALGVANARDMRAVIATMARQPFIDASRIVIAGQSFGGWNTLAAGTLDIPGVKGLVNFSGGVRDSSCKADDAGLIAAAGFFGANTRVPSLWFYGENDQLFPVATWRAMYARYTSAGGHAELVDIGRFMTDSHQMLSYQESLPMWTAKVDAFLKQVGLPSTVMNAAYLPTPWPAPSHFAAIEDVAKVPYLSEKGRALYRAFLAKPLPRVFVIAPDGTAAVFDRGFDPLRRALDACSARVTGCQVYALDNDVVWRGAPATTAAQLERQVTATIPQGRTVTLDTAYSVNPDCSLHELAKLWITQPPTHGSASVVTRQGHLKFPPTSPLAKCDGVSVPVVAVDYTPAAGFTGTDALRFEEINAAHQDVVFKFALNVK